MSNPLTAPDVDAQPGAWLAPLAPEPPAWVQSLTDWSGDASHRDFRRVAAEIPNATALPDAQLESAVAEAYASLRRDLRDTGHHPVRFWNYVPAIHADLGGGRDRYMVFNAGRFAAFREWFGSSAVFSRTLPTASAVGVGGCALVVHGLATRQPGAPVENPRQIPAYSYSKRFGPLPPCFARGTIVAGPGGERRLLIGGTASIVGELSQHERHVRDQVSETFQNLAHLIATARGDAQHEPASRALDAFEHVRVYVVRSEDADLIRDLVRDAMPARPNLEFAQADLCRRELLVEIEGYARL
jgi:chorismate lyase/3-hydroxybenzoate synthase